MEDKAPITKKDILIGVLITLGLILLCGVSEAIIR